MMNKFLKHITLYFFLVGGLIFLFAFSHSIIVKNVPNDLSRHQLIAEKLNNNTDDAEIVIFGSSLSMFGVDAKEISNNLPQKPIAYNLSSVGQAIPEGIYFMSQIKGKVKNVVHCIGYKNLNETGYYLGDSKAISMLMNGYKLKPSTKDLIKHPNENLEKSKLQVGFESRTFIKSALHNVLRKAMDSESFNDKINDLYYPYIYEKDRHNNYPNYKVDIDYTSYSVKDTMANMVVDINAFLAKNNIKYHLIIIPLNPDMGMPSTKAHNKFMAQVNKKLKGIDVLDLSHLLPSEDFYDAFHPNTKGAKKIAQKIAEHLKSN